jgi:hypothetical protein
MFQGSIEIEAGIVTALPDWMLDAGICASMALGTARGSADALRDLRRFLPARGFRRSSCGDLPVAVGQGMPLA